MHEVSEVLRLPEVMVVGGDRQPRGACCESVLMMGGLLATAAPAEVGGGGAGRLPFDWLILISRPWMTPRAAAALMRAANVLANAVRVTLDTQPCTGPSARTRGPRYRMSRLGPCSMHAPHACSDTTCACVRVQVSIGLEDEARRHMTDFVKAQLHFGWMPDTFGTDLSVVRHLCCVLRMLW